MGRFGGYVVVLVFVGVCDAVDLFCLIVLITSIEL